MNSQLAPSLILAIIGGYFLMLLIVSFFTSRNGSNNANFFVGSKQSPWYAVAFGMIGASLSGVTFISIPGVVGASSGVNIHFSYMQVVFGYLLGYALIANVLMPVYYRLNLTSIYTYLEQRFGVASYKTGAAFFILSKIIGATFRLYLVAIVLDVFVLGKMGVPFAWTVVGTIALIWLYTFRSGIKTIVWTDTLQTVFMLASVVLTAAAIGSELGLDFWSIFAEVQQSKYSQIFFFEGGWSDPNNFFKQFLSGASIAFVMTGLDQDMMQKNLSCRNIKEAKKNMYSLSITLVFVNLLFLTLGALLYLFAAAKGVTIPAKTDQLFPTIAFEHLPPAIGIVFIIGLVAAAYSSADSALTALTTSFCIDFLNFEKKEENENSRQTRTYVHIGFSIVFVLVILWFKQMSGSSVINQLFTIAGYTYGPLLGLYIFGFFTKINIHDRLAPAVCILAPIICYFLSQNSEKWLWGYKFGFELLILNGLLTFAGLWLIRKRGFSA